MNKETQDRAFVIPQGTECKSLKTDTSSNPITVSFAKDIIAVPIEYFNEEVKQLREYTKHYEPCSWWNNGGGDCNCGLDKLMNHFKSELSGETNTKGVQMNKDGTPKIQEGGLPVIKMERTFTEAEIFKLQNEVHKITGDGEVMQCFNKILGIAAG